MNQERIHELQAKGQWDEIAALLTPSNYQQELSRGIFKAESKKYVSSKSKNWTKNEERKASFWDARNSPLLSSPRTLKYRYSTTTRLHSQMAVDFILGQQRLARVRPDQ